MKKNILFLLVFVTGLTLSAQSPFQHQAKPDNIGGHITTINHPSTNGKPGNLLFVSQVYGKYNDHQIGVWYNNGKWKIYNEDLTAMPASMNFNILSVPPSGKAFTVTGNASNTSQNWTRIDHPSTNNNPNAILFVTQNYAGKYNAKPIGVYYDGKHWAIYLQDRSGMPTGLRWNVLVGSKGTGSNISGATVSVVTAANTNKTNSLGKYIVSTNERNSNQRVFFTQRWGSGATYNNNIPAMWWDGSSWTIFNANRKEIANGAGFSIMAFGQNKGTAPTPTPTPRPSTPAVPPAEVLNQIDLDAKGNAITGLNVGFIDQDGTGTNIGQVGDKLWAEANRWGTEWVETGRDANKVYLKRKDGTTEQIIDVAARKITLMDGGQVANNYSFVYAKERQVVGSDSSPKMRLNATNWKYTVDGVKSVNNSPWKEPTYKYQNGVENLWLQQKGGFGNPPNDRFQSVPGHNNLYRKGLRYLEIKGPNLFTLDGKLYVGYEEAAPAPVRKIEATHRFDKSMDTRYDSNPLDDNNSLDASFTSELNLRLYTNYYRDGGENKLYVSLGQNQSSLTPSVGGLKWNAGNERGWFLLDVETKIVPKGIGSSAGLSLDKFGPSTSTLSGTEANSHEISLDVPLDGSAPTASSTISKTVTVSSDDFRVRTYRNANEMDVKYYLAFTKDGGTVRENEPKDLAITVDPTNTGIFKVRANAAELPVKATSSFPLMAHGLWKVNRGFSGALEVRVVVEATYCRVFRKSKYNGFDAALRIMTIKRQFETTAVIPAMYLQR